MSKPFKLDDNDRFVMRPVLRDQAGIFVTDDMAVLRAYPGRAISLKQAHEQMEARLRALGGPAAPAAPPGSLTTVSGTKEDDETVEASPEQLALLRKEGKRTTDHFHRLFRDIPSGQARALRRLRVEKGYSWRALARYYANHFTTGASWAGNQIAGMVLCQIAAERLGEDWTRPPWNDEA